LNEQLGATFIPVEKRKADSALAPVEKRKADSALTPVEKRKADSALAPEGKRKADSAFAPVGKRKADSALAPEGRRIIAQDKRSAVLGKMPKINSQPRRGEGKTSPLCGRSSCANEAPNAFK